eukprot:3733533-Amphidinium_carterae.1
MLDVSRGSRIDMFTLQPSWAFKCSTNFPTIYLTVLLVVGVVSIWDPLQATPHQLQQQISEP